jgi:hypothetical protein
MVSFIVEVVVNLFFEAISSMGWNRKRRSKDDEP